MVDRSGDKPIARETKKIFCNGPLADRFGLKVEQIYSLRHLLTRQKNQPKKRAPHALTPRV